MTQNVCNESEQMKSLEILLLPKIIHKLEGPQRAHTSTKSLHICMHAYVIMSESDSISILFQALETSEPCNY